MRSVVLATLLTSLLLASCGGKSGSAGSSPLAKQLVGHWASPSDDHEYFGAIDAGTHTGSYILVHPDGKAFNHHYRVDSADAGDRKLETTLLFAGGDSREKTFVFSTDGKSVETASTITGIETRSRLDRVDDKTAPD